MKHVIKTIAFVLIAAVVILVLNKRIEPKFIYSNSFWPVTSTYEQFYEMEKNSVDVIFLGSSVVENAFIPQTMYDTYGIRSYNLGSEQQSILLSWWWLNEALKYQSPKVVVLDSRFLFPIHEENPINTVETLTRKCIDPMRFSANKIKAVHDICTRDPSQNELSYYLTNIRYHDRWTELAPEDIDKTAYRPAQLKGYGISTLAAAGEWVPFVPQDTDAREEVDPLMKEYLDKIKDLLAERGIKLILISLPGDDFTEAMQNTVAEYAEQTGTDYYNFNREDIINAIGAELPAENVLIHMNLQGAAKTSNWFGGVLSEQYGVPSVSDSQWEETEAFYQQAVLGANVQRATDVYAYLNTIAFGDYTIFMSGKEDCSSALDQNLQYLLFQLGIMNEIPPGDSFCAILSKDNQQMAIGDEDQTLDGVIKNSAGILVDYHIGSGGSFASHSSTIVINGKEYSCNDAGLNIVIYDNLRNMVIDSVCFNTGIPEHTCTKKGSL